MNDHYLMLRSCYSLDGELNLPHRRGNLIQFGFQLYTPRKEAVPLDSGHVWLANKLLIIQLFQNILHIIIF